MIRLLLGVTLPLYLLDQLTKALVLHFISPDHPRPVIPDFFTLVQWHNTGAAFSLLSNNNAFFIGLSSVALIALAIFARRGAFSDRWMALGAALLAAGILGNLTDRLLHGYVVDFLLFDLHVPFASPWPAFNIADSCICVAAVIFILSSLFEKKPAAPDTAQP
ncbi:MAG TPA: signal peptidase II [Chthoniobacterales bacterium]|jgi:signal peptidase II